MATKSNGYILHEDSQILVIATCFTRRSNNPKTGDMIQIWILGRAENPVAAVKSGQDSIVCFDCKHRGMNGKDRTCYVRVANAPLGIWKAYQRGNYPTLAIGDYARVFNGRTIRFGAYGDPVLIPLPIVTELARVAHGHTGYTHQWKLERYQDYKQYLMASCDNPREWDEAKSLGWRTFRVRSENGALLPREIICPASPEGGKRSTCERCRLCSGTRANDPRKDVVIIVHGIGARKFELIQIAA